MLRTAVLLLVGIPLLMPPGMCICRYLPCEQLAVSLENQGDDPLPPCCRRASRGSSESRDGCGIAIARHSPTVSYDLDPQTPTAPDGSRHLPGCPALKPSDHTRFVVPGFSLAGAVDLVGASFATVPDLPRFALSFDVPAPI